MSALKVGIVGATGYGGLELIRFLHNHSAVEQIELFTSSEEGVIFSSKFGHLVQIADIPLQKLIMTFWHNMMSCLQVHLLG